MCLLSTYRNGCQIYKLRFQLGPDLGIDWYFGCYSNVRYTMSDYYGATFSNIKATRYTALDPVIMVREIVKVKYEMLICY